MHDNNNYNCNRLNTQQTRIWSQKYAIIIIDILYCHNFNKTLYVPTYYALGNCRSLSNHFACMYYVAM